MMRIIVLLALCVFLSLPAAAQPNRSIDSCYLESGISYRLRGAQFQRSADHGKTWSTVDSKVIYDKDKVDHNPWFALISARLYFLDDSTGFIIGRTDCYQWREPLLRTSDGGKTWRAVVSRQQGKYPFVFHHSPGSSLMHFRDAHNGVVLAGIEQAFLIVGHTTDGGKRWRLENVSFPKEYYPFSMTFSDPLNGEILLTAAERANKKLVTIDGGRTWKLQQ